MASDSESEIKKEPELKRSRKDSPVDPRLRRDSPAPARSRASSVASSRSSKSRASSLASGVFDESEEDVAQAFDDDYVKEGHWCRGCGGKFLLPRAEAARCCQGCANDDCANEFGHTPHAEVCNRLQLINAVQLKRTETGWSSKSEELDIWLEFEERQS